MRRTRQGFTMVEVMVSLGIMTVAGMAILAMQQQVTRANVHARQLTIATQIAQNWIERLKLDSLRWTAAGNPPAGTFIGDGIGAVGTIAGFTTIPQRIVTDAAGVQRVLSPAFDYYGDDLDLTDGSPANLFYCASHRLNWVYANQRLIRADVRVWWAREGVASIRADYPVCADDNNALNPPNGAHFNRYHVVYLSTVLRAAP